MVEVAFKFIMKYGYTVLPSWDLPPPPRTPRHSTACHLRSHSSVCSTAEKQKINSYVYVHIEHVQHQVLLIFQINAIIEILTEA